MGPFLQAFPFPYFSRTSCIANISIPCCTKHWGTTTVRTCKLASSEKGVLQLPLGWCGKLRYHTRVSPRSIFQPVSCLASGVLSAPLKCNIRYFLKNRCPVKIATRPTRQSGPQGECFVRAALPSVCFDICSHCNRNTDSSLCYW